MRRLTVVLVLMMVVAVFSVVRPVSAGNNPAVDIVSSILREKILQAEAEAKAKAEAEAKEKAEAEAKAKAEAEAKEKAEAAPAPKPKPAAKKTTAKKPAAKPAATTVAPPAPPAPVADPLAPPQPPRFADEPAISAPVPPAPPAVVAAPVGQPTVTPQPQPAPVQPAPKPAPTPTPKPVQGKEHAAERNAPVVSNALPLAEFGRVSEAGNLYYKLFANASGPVPEGVVIYLAGGTRRQKEIKAGEEYRFYLLEEYLNFKPKSQQDLIDLMAPGSKYSLQGTTGIQGFWDNDWIKPFGFLHYGSDQDRPVGFKIPAGKQASYWYQ